MREAMAADVLSDVLRTVRLTGATFFDVVAKAPWAVESPPRERILPEILPGAEHLIAYPRRYRGAVLRHGPWAESRSRSKPAKSSCSPKVIRMSCRAIPACLPILPRPISSQQPPPAGCRCLSTMAATARLPPNSSAVTSPAMRGRSIPARQFAAGDQSERPTRRRCRMARSVHSPLR